MDMQRMELKPTQWRPMQLKPPGLQWACALLSAVLLAGCDKPVRDAWQGYIEGEYVNLAAPAGGQLLTLFTRRGEQVVAGKPVFVLEQESERAARQEARERLSAALARIENLRTGRRAPELEPARSQLAQARSALELSAAQLAQAQKLYASKFVSQARVDEAWAVHGRDVARVNEAESQIRALELPLGRAPELQASRAEADAARAVLAQVEWRLAQKTFSAPASGLVQDTYFAEGEWVPAGRPVLAILPPGRVKARFYVPEGALSSVSVGTKMEISCDGCGAPIGAAVSYVSTQAEYTPPVLYSKDARAKLVFLIEARPSVEDAAKLHPGQPVDVRLAGPAATVKRP